MLDDEVMWWALRKWAAWKSSVRGNNKQLVEALKRHSLNLVRRRRPWKSIELSKEKHKFAEELVKELIEKKDKLRFECFVDSLHDLPYKDLTYSVKPDADPEQDFFKEIFLVDKEGITDRLSNKMIDSPILRALNEEIDVYRFYYDRKFSKKFDGLLTKYGVC